MYGQTQIKYLLHVSEAADKLLVLKLATLIVAFSDSLQENSLIAQFYLCREPRWQFGRSGDSELNEEAEKMREQNEGRTTGTEKSMTFGGTEEKEEEEEDS